MIKLLNNLLKIQIAIAIFIFVLFFIIYQEKMFYLSSLTGSGISIFSTFVLKVFWQKLPKVINNNLFYKLAIFCEIFKWLVILLFFVMILTKTKFYPHITLISFFINYLGSYWIAILLR